MFALAGLALVQTAIDINAHDTDGIAVSPAWPTWSRACRPCSGTVSFTVVPDNGSQFWRRYPCWHSNGSPDFERTSYQYFATLRYVCKGHVGAHSNAVVSIGRACETF